MPDRRWLILAMLFAARAATGFQFQSVGSSTHLLMRDLAIDYSEIGMLIGAYLLPGVAVAFPTGLLGARLTDKTLGIAGLALMVLSGLGLAASNGLVAALLARTIGGVGATIVALVATKLVTDWFDRREITLAMSLLQMSWPFGAMLALPIQAHVAQLWGWPAVMISGAVCAGAALCCFTLVSEPQQRSEAAATGRVGLPVSVWLPVTVAGVIWGAANLACILFFSYAPLAMAARGIAPTTAASLTSLSIWLTIVAIPCGGYVVQRLGAPVGAICVCGPIAALALLSFALDVYPTTACLIFGIAVGPLSGAILSLPAAILAPLQRPVGFGIFYTCFYVLMAVGPSVAGRLQDAWNSPIAALIAAAILLAVGLPLSLSFIALSQPSRVVASNEERRLRATS
ncbi:MAG TPA: MFS transporter [Bradyrhizobium sp.]|nr:MFS transporter [Bradyrhizobium sp.]